MASFTLSDKDFPENWDENSRQMTEEELLDALDNLGASALWALPDDHYLSVGTVNEIEIAIAIVERELELRQDALDA